MKLTGFCNDPSPGSHRYCDELIVNPDRKITCACACHTDMAPFDELDIRLRERLSASADLQEDDVELEPHG